LLYYYFPFDNDIRSCLNDLCQRVTFIVDQSLTEIYNQLPSPVFKRKMETKNVINNQDEQLLKKKPNRLSRKKSLTENEKKKMNQLNRNYLMLNQRFQHRMLLQHQYQQIHRIIFVNGKIVEHLLQPHEQFFIMFVQLMLNIYQNIYVYGMDVIE